MLPSKQQGEWALLLTDSWSGHERTAVQFPVLYSKLQDGCMYGKKNIKLQK